jgi:hypothetical protein
MSGPWHRRKMPHTTHLHDIARSVTILRERHPFEGRSLVVIRSRLRRHPNRLFAKFNELGSVRRVWLWFRSEGLSFPLQTCYGGCIRWVDASYIAIYHVSPPTGELCRLRAESVPERKRGA